MNPKAFLGLLKESFDSWNQDKAPRLGAALAYYTIFSLSPLLVIVVAIASLVFGQKAAEGQIVGQIENLVGSQAAQAIQTMLQNGYRPSDSIIVTIVGFATLLLGAGGLFGALQDALNTIWEVTPKPNRGIKGLIQDRFLSFTMVLGTGFLLLVSLVISAVLAALTGTLANFVPSLPVVIQVINLVLDLVVITALFAMIFKVLPDVTIAWSDVWIGAAFTSLLFVIGKFLLGFYLGRGSLTSSYGAAASLVIILLWVYYAAQILLLGAEFARAYANKYGSHVRPAPNAIAVTREMRAQEGLPTQKGGLSTEKSGGSSAAVKVAAATPVESNTLPVPTNGNAKETVREEQRILYRRDVAALLGFIAGAIAGARTMRVNGKHNHSE